MKLRVLLVDDHPLIREGIKSLLQPLPDFELVGEAASIAEARPLVQDLRPDLLILDVGLPDGSGVDLAAWTRQQLPDACILMMSEDSYADSQTIKAVLRFGVHGYLARSEPLERFVEAARAVGRGEMAYTDRALENADLDSDHKSEALAPREMQVAQLIQAGQTNAEIADELHIGVKTVGTHIVNIRQKLSARNRTEVATIITALRGRHRIGLAVGGVLGVLALSSGFVTASLVLGRPSAPTAGASRIDLAALPATNGPLTAASTAEEVQAKLLRTNTAYQNLSARMTLTDVSSRILSDVVLSVEQPDRFRIESKASDGSRMTAVSNGQDVWLHRPDGIVEPRKNTSRAATTIPPTDPRPDRIIIPVSALVTT